MMDINIAGLLETIKRIPRIRAALSPHEMLVFSQALRDSADQLDFGDGERQRIRSSNRTVIIAGACDRPLMFVRKNVQLGSF